MAEAAGLPDFEMGVTYAIWAPAGTPSAIIERIATEAAGAMRAPSAQAILAQNGVEVLPPMNAAERSARPAWPGMPQCSAAWSANPA